MKNNLPHMKATCASCPFRKDAQESWLGEERATEISEATSFVCHKTIKGADKDRRQCAGHMILRGAKNEFVQTADALGIELELSGRGLVFDNENDFINHHKY